MTDETQRPGAATTTRADPPPAPKAAAAPVWTPPHRHPITVLLVVIFTTGAVLAILAAWHLPPFGGRYETTENAYIRGRIVVIAPEVSGYVVDVAVKDYEKVKAGDVLVRIDARIYKAKVDAAQASLDAAQAGLANARAQLTRAQADMKRIDELSKNGWVSVQVRDNTLAALRQAEAQAQLADGDKGSFEAQVDAARAQLALAKIDLEHTVIRAPEDGQLSEVGVRLGQFVTNGTQLLSLVPPERWVIANFKEGQTARIALGQPACFTVDGLAGARFKGHVERLSPAAGSEFAVLKPDNATGNFVKVPQRIGVRISIDPDQSDEDRLKPGMSVEARVDTAKTDNTAN